ncbi:MAG: hypothetical protein WBC44_02835 [Planctomycetaceae bacterium]
MADAKQTDYWNHTAAVLALLANVHRDPKKGKAFKPADFHPALKRSPPTSSPAPKVDVSILKTVFVRDT